MNSAAFLARKISLRYPDGVGIFVTSSDSDRFANPESLRGCPTTRLSDSENPTTPGNIVLVTAG
jgi:hypothetical protein